MKRVISLPRAAFLGRMKPSSMSATVRVPDVEPREQVLFIGGRPTDVTGRRGINTRNRPDHVVTLETADGFQRRFSFWMGRPGTVSGQVFHGRAKISGGE